MKKLILFFILPFMALFAFTGYVIYKDYSAKVFFESGGKSNYAAERAAFKTALIRKGPAPQDYKEVKVPENALEVTYKSGDLELKAWVSKNIDKSKKYPAVVYIHGDFAFSEENWGQVKEFMDAGFVVMTPMLRGENGNPGSFEFMRGEVDDIIAAGEFMSSQSYVDNKNIFLAGHSIGGGGCVFASMLPSPYKAVASFGGAPLDLKTDIKANPSLQEMLPFDPKDEKELLIRLPMNYPESIITPLFMFVESDSHLAGIKEQTAAFVEAANRNGKKADYCIVQGDHLSALKEEISMCTRVFSLQLNEKKVVFVTLNPQTPENVAIKDDRDLVKLRLIVMENWSLSKDAEKIVNSIDDENEKRAVEICTKFVKEGLPYWDDKLIRELTSKELYSQKMAFAKNHVTAGSTQTMLKSVTDKIEIINNKTTIQIYFEDIYDIKDTTREGDSFKALLYHTMTVDTATWRITDYKFKSI